jgi:hypothetical protein
MSNVKIKRNEFDYNVMRYFRGNSENVQLGSYGDKKTPALQSNYLSVSDQLSADALALAKVRVGKPLAIDWSKESKADVEAPVKYLTVVDGKATFTHEAAKDAKLVLVKFSIDMGPLIKVLNEKAPEALDYLKESDKRVVSDVWVAMEAELAEKFGSEAGVKATANHEGLQLEVSSGLTTGTKTKVTIGEGTTFAYLLMKPKWDHAKNRIVELEDDQIGLN